MPTLKLDPRTEILLLIVANVVAFAQRRLWLEVTWVGLLLLLIIACGCVKSAGKLAVGFGICLLLQYIIFPNGPKILANTFYIIVSYARKIFPCLIIGTLLVKKTTIREVMAALRKWHVPQGLIIPLSVTIRYFPALKEETRLIRDAMKLRNIHGIQRMEGTLVPIMISATTTAEELSAAAVTRGIENPCRKTSLVVLKYRASDIICLILAGCFCVTAFVLG